jgi:hypothetical protein
MTLTLIDSQTEFCRALKIARERRGLSLDDIAAVTKVCASYFDALERGDLTHWPKAIFRRSFFRAYVEMIGLPVAEAMDAFTRLFPDDDAPAPLPPPTPAAAPLRLELDASWRGLRMPIRPRLAAAVIDVALVLAASAMAWAAGMHLASAIALISIAYFTLGGVWLGGSPAFAALRRARSTQTNAEERQDEVEVQVDVTDTARPREWTSDARRVRPRQGRARLRVKVPTHSRRPH